jgi:hypothetical protein
VQAEHLGRAKTSSGAAGYVMTSVLRPSTGICELWGIRYRSARETPFSRFVPVSGVSEDTCQILGFLGDSQLGTCSYGVNDGNCGFTTDIGYAMRNNCISASSNYCTINPGTYTEYLRQGPFSSLGILSNMSGSIRTHCRGQ